MLQCGHKGTDIVYTGNFKCWRKICKNAGGKVFFQVCDPKLSEAGGSPVLVLRDTLKKVTWKQSHQRWKPRESCRTVMILTCHMNHWPLRNSGVFLSKAGHMCRMLGKVLEKGTNCDCTQSLALMLSPILSVWVEKE